MRGQERRSASTNTAPTVTHSAGSVVENPSLDVPGIESESSQPARSLWDRAYKALEEQNPGLVKRYQNVLAEEDPETICY